MINEFNIISFPLLKPKIDDFLMKKIIDSTQEEALSSVSSFQEVSNHMRHSNAS